MAVTASVSLESLKNAAGKLENQRSIISTAYNEQVAPVLDSSKECLKVSGVDTLQTKAQFDKVYKDLDKQLSGLVSLLNDKVIPSYNELVEALKKLFNNEFASKFQELINGMR